MWPERSTATGRGHSLSIDLAVGLAPYSAGTSVVALRTICRPTATIILRRNGQDLLT
jgi:hypothetical protein